MAGRRLFACSDLAQVFPVGLHAGKDIVLVVPLALHDVRLCALGVRDLFDDRPVDEGLLRWARSCACDRKLRLDLVCKDRPPVGREGDLAPVDEVLGADDLARFLGVDHLKPPGMLLNKRGGVRARGDAPADVQLEDHGRRDRFARSYAREDIYPRACGIRTCGCDSRT